MKKLLFLIRYGWVVLGIVVVAFMGAAFTVYFTARPNNVTEVLPYNTLLPRSEELVVSSGDLEIYPHVTRVYTYGTNVERLNIRFVGREQNQEMRYGVVEDASAPYNYFVECFVVSDIADKSLVRRLWNISVQEEDVLTFTETKAVKTTPHVNFNGDLKRDVFIRGSNWYITIMRITVQPGFNNVGFSNINKEVSDRERAGTVLYV